MTTWDTAVDVVIVGSGGGGMVAALAAADAGVSALVLEKQKLLGGSTAMSGGIVWVPNNPVMQAIGVPDSFEDAMIHFEAVVGDVGSCSSSERRGAFLTAGPEMVAFLQRLGVRFVYCRGYSDYYSNAKGGHDLGRGIEPIPFDGHVLGEWLERLQPGLAQSLGLAVMTNEARSLSHYNRSIGAFAVSARVVMRTYAARLRRQALLTNGASLIGQMLKIVIDRGVDVWTEAPLEQLIVENGVVVGVRTTHEGTPMSIRARRGVLLASGGFAHNAEMREEYGGDQPNRARWSISNPGDTGEVMQEAMRLGAKTDLMDEAWWLPSPRTGRFGQSTLDQARQRPRTIYVDAAGRRFVNESNSYMEVGKEMYARNKTSRAVPCWLIFDDRYRKRYAHQRSSPGRFPRKLLESGMLKQAWTLDDLAHMCDIDPAGLAETIEGFNENARNGIDPDYGRGESAYNRALGDPNHRVHPCLGPIDEPPYYAVQVVPGDIGTCGGLLTDEHARVIGADDEPIEGLYATGNGTATVMGRHYLGPGASIANTMVFGYVSRRATPPAVNERGHTMSEFKDVSFFTNRSIQDDPYPYFDWVRAQSPVWREPNYGMYMITGHSEAMTVYTDPASFPPNNAPSGTFSSCNVVCGSFQKFSSPFEGDDVSDIIVKCRSELPFSDQLPAFDPPNHTAHRHLLMRLITPKRLKENEDFMWRHADRLIDGFLDAGSCEMVSAYAEPFTLTVIADLEGVPEADHSLFRERLSTAHQEITHKPLEFLYERFSGYIEDRRAHPRNDVLTGLATATFPDGSTPEVHDAALIAANLFSGGQETTVRLLSFTLRMLGERPDLQKVVREDRKRIPNFIEETLRLESPLRTQFRMARVSTELAGVEIPAGSSLMLVPGACNRDPRMFENPYEFDINRSNARQHIAFGHGIHTCAGAPLARAEGAVTVNRFLDRTSDITISEEEHGPPGARTYDYLPTFFLRGLQRLHLDLAPTG